MTTKSWRPRIDGGLKRLLAGSHAFRNILDMHFNWYREVFRLLKNRNRVISLADYAAEKSLHHERTSSHAARWGSGLAHGTSTRATTSRKADQTAA
jgi:hypothetical protein